MKEDLNMKFITPQNNCELHTERALQASYPDDITKRVKVSPLVNTGWVNIYGNIHTNVISCGKKIFTTHKAAVQDKYRAKDGLVYIATTRIDW